LTRCKKILYDEAMKTILLTLFLLLSSTYILADSLPMDENAALKLLTEDAKEDKKSDNSAEEKECLDQEPMLLLHFSDGTPFASCKTAIPSEYFERDHKPPRLS
jgi:hypothetical protein